MSAHKALSLLLLVVAACEGASLVLEASTLRISKDGEANFTMNCTTDEASGSGEHSQIEKEIVDVQRMRIAKMKNNRWEPILQMDSDWESPVINPGVTGDHDLATGFLQATWSMATNSTAGEYTCDLIGYGRSGQVVSLRSPAVYVDVHFPMTLYDLFKMVKTSSKKFDTASADIARNKEAIMEASADIARESAKIAQNKKAIETASADIAKNKEAFEGTSTDIAENKEAIEGALANITQNKEVIEKTSGDIVWIKKSFESSSTHIAQNTEAIKTASAIISQNEEAINMATANITQNKEGLEMVSADITENKEAIKMASADITKNTEAIENVSADINENKRAIEMAVVDITDNKEAIEMAVVDITENKQAIKQTKTGHDTLNRMLQQTSNTVENNAATLAEVKQKQNFTTSFFQRWPQGIYHLLRPKSGCPRDTATTDWSYVRYSGIPTDSKVTTSTGSHVDLGGSSNTILYMNLCSVYDTPSLGSLWPLGTYCINKAYGHGCPTGFRKGDITYTSDLWIDYCCRDDSPPDIAILLPRENPFYLHRIGGKCQHVWGMSVTEEYITIDTKCCNSKYTDPVPDGKKTSSEITLQLCYYENVTK